MSRQSRKRRRANVKIEFWGIRLCVSFRTRPDKIACPLKMRRSALGHELIPKEAEVAGRGLTSCQIDRVCFNYRSGMQCRHAGRNCGSVGVVSGEGAVNRESRSGAGAAKDNRRCFDSGRCGDLRST